MTNHKKQEMENQNMTKEKQTLIDWVKEHKKELTFSGVSIVAIILAIVGIKNRVALEEMWEMLKNSVDASAAANAVAASSTAAMTPAAIPSYDPFSLVPNEITTKIGTSKIPHHVNGHKRALPAGWKASAAKLASAAEAGFTLLPGETWVEGYDTGAAA